MEQYSNNWGNCARPQCMYQSARCQHQYCSKCCLLDHGYAHERPWVRQSQMSDACPPVSQAPLYDFRGGGKHAITCICMTCMAEAREIARKTAEKDAAALPANYSADLPEPEPKLGEMKESEVVDWPLEPNYWRAKTNYEYKP